MYPRYDRGAHMPQQAIAGRPAVCLSQVKRFALRPRKLLSRPRLSVEFLWPDHLSASFSGQELTVLNLAQVTLWNRKCITQVPRRN
jgi:hypothetical protein